MSQPLLSVRTIDHIAVVAKDLEASRAFYQDVLGMIPVPHPDFPFPGLWFQAGQTQIHVIFAGAFLVATPNTRDGRYVFVTHHCHKLVTFAICVKSVAKS